MENGNIYIGEWMNGMRNGRGKEIGKEGDMIYEGYWQNNIKYGRGRILTNENIYLLEYL